jgi:hypothetical protein
VAHRYDEVTVLQADMVGFTNLSAQRSAEFVLGLLSDLFDKFDALTEMHHTHKVRLPPLVLFDKFDALTEMHHTHKAREPPACFPLVLPPHSTFVLCTSSQPAAPSTRYFIVCLARTLARTTRPWATKKESLAPPP